ncbi:MAG: LysR family transcriptional regulator [Mesorhizobium sp.]|nr:LysR family transcriptional regulator [Mesorhizobium sp.]MBN9242300.1 LysR family transcriptional regulator [Mesorhizobium sp.]
MSDLNWDDCRIFLALAREGTLSGAARQLRTGVATVSRRIERMEHALGLPLFLRTQTGYMLTDQGETMISRAEAVELAMLEMRQEASDHAEIRGVVRLTSIESLVAPLIVPALAPLLGANPGLDVEILFSTATINMHRHDADLALRMVRPERGHLRVRQLATMGFGLYGPPDGSRPGRMITWPEAASLGTLLKWSEAFEGQHAPRLAVNTLPGQTQAVRCGIGVAVLPHLVARDAGLQLLTDRLPGGEPMQRPILLVTHADLAASRRVVSVAEAVGGEIVRHRRSLAEP